MKHEAIRTCLLEMGRIVCDHVHGLLREQRHEELSAVVAEDQADTIFAIDRAVEALILPMLAERAKSFGGLVLIAEGISGDETEGGIVLPEGMDESEAKWRIIIDPIDGTRGIMYDKRAAFFLAGAAPNRGASTGLQDIEVSVMVELPTSKSIFSDELSAIRGQGVQAFCRNLLTNESVPRAVSPSKASTIYGGFAQISRFFPHGKALTAQIEEELVFTLFPDAPANRAFLFEDQYISTGGQLYEMLKGHDRFVADVRHRVFQYLAQKGIAEGMTCHPYDMAAWLIADEAGILLTNAHGEPINAPLDTTSPVDWMGYANEAIRQEVEPILQNILRQKLDLTI
jgi:hypothetical protein